MNIKKFEQYEIDKVFGDIVEEYAKRIISKSIDNDLDNETLEDTYYDICKGGEELEEHQEIVKIEIIKYLKNFYWKQTIYEHLKKLI